MSETTQRDVSSAHGPSIGIRRHFTREGEDVFESVKWETRTARIESGQILIDGRPVHIGSAFDAQTFAVAAIYQEPMVSPDLTVAENIFIGHRDRGRIVNRRRMREERDTSGPWRPNPIATSTRCRSNPSLD